MGMPAEELLVGVPAVEPVVASEYSLRMVDRGKEACQEGRE